MTTAVEREVKLSAPDGFELPDLSVVDDVGTVDRDTIELDALYVDTAELDLIRRGASLRRRREPAGTVWTLKLPNELGQPLPGLGRAPLLERRELDVHDDADTVPTLLADVVVPWVRDRSLVPVARLHTVRRRHRLLGATGVVLAEATDDDVAVWDPADTSAPVASFRELEVEAGPQVEVEVGLAAVAGTVAQLERAGAGLSRAVSKAAQAIGPAAHVAPDPPGEAPAADADTPALLAGALRARVAELLDADVRVRMALWVDEHVDMAAPVAAMLRSERAVRAQLRVARPLLDREASDEARAVLRRLSAPLLRAHDSLVVAATLRADAVLLADDDREVLEPLVHEATVDADAAEQLLSARLASPAHTELLVGLVSFATRPPDGTDALGAPLPSASELAAAAWTKLCQAVTSLGVDGRDQGRELEDLRPKVRRAWAAALVAAPGSDESAGRADRLESLLAHLDQLRDALLVEDRLRGLALGAPRPQVLALGQLLGEARRRTAHLTASWPLWWGEATGVDAERAAAAAS